MISASLRILFILLVNLCSGHVLAYDIETVLASERPPGIVFEIVAGEEAMLDTQLPALRRDIERLREKFPGLPVAIVSHGREQFAMTTRNAEEHRTAHTIVKQFVEKDGVDFHVCGTHASWYDVSPEDFPSYVDVSTTGPGQINDYEELGYELIVID
jgi:intracellular sulfur oxidation DsrE/DsrF family protein